MSNLGTEITRDDKPRIPFTLNLAFQRDSTKAGIVDEFMATRFPHINLTIKQCD